MESGTKKPRIVFVEDDRTLSTLFTMRFESEGFEVMTASDGDAGLKAVAEFDPDLVLCDLMMPHVSGFEVIEKLRSDPANAKIKVVVMSALSRPDDIEKAKSLGADDFIVKSQISMDEVIERLQTHLKHRSAALND